MAARRGTTTPSKIYRGTVPVKKVMRGTVEVWSASIYPISGAWGPVTPPILTEHIILTHTIEESGNYTLTITGSAPSRFVKINSGGNLGQPWTGPLNVGDIVQLSIATAGGTHSGTWSIVKN